jgi:hypothetical protein
MTRNGTASSGNYLCRYGRGAGVRIDTELLVPSPGGQVSGMGDRAIPSTSLRATTRPTVGGAGEGGRRLRRGPPTAGRAVGLQQVDGMALVGRGGAAALGHIWGTSGPGQSNSR